MLPKAGVKKYFLSCQSTGACLYIFLSAIKRGTTQMFCRQGEGTPPLPSNQISLRAPKRLGASPALKHQVYLRTFQSSYISKMSLGVCSKSYTTNMEY